MAVTWEVDNSKKLILKVDGVNVATIEGGLNSEITGSSGDVTGGISNFIADVKVFEPAVADDESTTDVDESKAAVPGVITLKKAALGTDEITLIPESAYTYTLALEDADENHQVKGDENVSANWKVTDGADTYEGTKTATYYAEGTPTTWTLETQGADAGKKIKYKASVAGSASVEITGLNNGLRVGDLNVTSNPPIAFTTEPTMSDGETPAVTEEGVITIAASALPSGSALPATGRDPITVELTTTGSGSTKYNLKLADGIAKFDANKGTATVDSISDGKATITRTQSAGWEEVTGGGDTLTYKPQGTKTIATVSGLKSDATTGVTVSGTTVTIAKDALDTNASTIVSIVDGTNGSDGDTDDNYKGFALALKDAKENKIGFEKIDEYWTLDGTTAKYWNGRQEGWTLNPTDATTDPGKIVYTAQDDNLLATISKLNSDVALGGNAVTVTGVTGAYSKIGTKEGEVFTEGITVSGNTITLSKAVLTHIADVTGESSVDNSTTLAQGKVLDSKTAQNAEGTATTYQLGLVSSEDTKPGTLGDISLSNITDNEGVKSAKVQQDTSEGWTLKESNTKISYTEAGKKDLATISGLDVTEAGEDVKIEGNTVVLTADAIGKTKTVDSETVNCSVTLTNHEGGNYTIARAENVKEPETIPSTFKLGELSTEADDSKSLKIMGTKAAGYTLSNDNKTITYTPAADVEVATISNLNKIVVVKDDKIGTNTGGNNNAFVEGITLKEDGTITLKEAVLTDAEVDDKATTLDTTKAEAITDLGVTFKLALDEDIAEPATEIKANSQKFSGVTADSATKTTTDGTLNIVGTLEKGWTLATTGTDANKKVTYTAEKTPILATISGLAKDTDISSKIILKKDADNNLTGEIELKKDILATTELTADSKVTISTTITTDGGLAEGQTDSLKDSYKFALAEDVDAPGKTVVGDPELTFPTEADGTATLVGKKSAGWVLDEENNTVKYVPEADDQVVAEITGLSLDANSTNVTFSGDVVTLKKAALTNKDVVITDKTTDTKYKLALGDDLPNLNPEKSKAGGETLNYWEKSGTTAKYYENKKEGWLLRTDKGNKTIAYTGQTKATLLATITNLNPEFTLGNTETDTAGIVRATSIGTGTYTTGANSTFVAGVQITPAVIDNQNPDNPVVTTPAIITLSKNVLGTTANKHMVLTEEAGDQFTLDASTETGHADLVVPQSAESAKVWELGSTTKYKEVTKEFWTLTDKTIKYTPQTSGTVLATITGLNPDVTEEDLKDTDVYSGTIGNVTDKGTITLNKNALNGRNVTINSNYYKLALNAETGLQNADKRVEAPKLENKFWELNSAKTIAYYKADVSEGYEATSDGSSVIHTAAETKKEIAKVTGLSGDKKLDVSDDKSYIGILNESNGRVSEGLKFGTPTADGQKPIVLSKEVLGTSNVAVTGTNYTLALDNEVSKTKTEADVWRVESIAAKAATSKTAAVPASTTATYKTIIPAYYTLGIGATAITYTPEATAKINTGTEQAPVYKDAIIATVTGLKSGLTVADDGKTLNGTDENGDAVNGVLTLNSKAVTLTKDALGTSNVEVKEGDAAGTDKYTLAFTTETGKIPSAPTDDTTSFTWSVSNTTATLKGTSTEGYTLVKEGTDADKKVTYTPANANKTFAVLTGLKSGITASELNVASGGPIVHDEDAKTLTLDMRVLGESDVTLDKENSIAGYTLALEENTSSNYKVDQNGASKKVWTVSGTTATYKNVVDTHYTLGQQEGTTGTVKDKITYVGREDAKTNAVIATITGLKTGLKVENDKIEGITLGNLNEGTFAPNESGTVIQLSKDVLGTTEAAIGQGSYTLALGEGVAPERDGGTFWTISGGTNANYQFKQTAGHTLSTDSKKAAYSQAGTKTIVTIEGLKSGIKLADVESGILVSQDEKEYKMTKNVLGTNATTTLKTGDAVADADKTNYKFAALNAAGDDAPATDNTVKYGWVKNGNDFELKSFIMPRYELTANKNDQEIKYTSWDQETLLATVTGLNTKAKLNTATRQIEGIDLSKLSDSTHTVTLTKADVFSGKNVTIAKATNAATEYTLAVDDAVIPKYSYEWTFKKGTGKNTANEKTGTATLTETMSVGYTAGTGDDAGKILYNAKKTVTTTIAGLNNNVTASSDKHSIGIATTGATPSYSGIDFTYGTGSIPMEGTFTLGANVLAGANVTLTNKSGGGKYTLKLDSSITQANVDEARWFKSNDTTAVYQTVTAQGYKETDDTKITYYSNSSGTPTTLATLKGLKNGFTEAQLNDDNILKKHDPETQSSSPNVTGNNADPEPTPATTTTPGNFTIKSNAILTNTNLTLTGVGEYKDYQLLLDSTNDDLKVTDIANEDATWTYSKGTANLNVGKTEGWSNKVTNKGKTTEKTDYKTIVYTKPAPVTIATVSGLAKTGVELSADKKSLTDGEKDIVVFEFGDNTTVDNTTTHNATITLSANALTTNNVTVTIPKKITGYAFKLDTDGDVSEPIDGDNYWTADGKGKAVYQYDTAAGYNLNEAKTTLAYAKAKTTTLATITGLDKNKVGKITKDVNNPVTEIEGIGVLSNPETTTTGEGANATTTNGVIKLWDDSLLGNKVTVTGNYEFELADEIKVKDGGSKWYFSGGTATYRDYTTAGYEFAKNKTDDNPKVVNKKAETAGTTYVTVKGLAKKIGTTPITADMVNEDDLLVVNEDHTVTISKDITGTATITLVNGVEKPKSGSTPATYYDYQIDAANSTYTTRVTDAPVWSFSKGTATLKQKTSAGFTLGALGENGQQKLTYSKAATPTVATVKGLNTNLIVDTDSTNTFTDGEIYATTTTKSGSTTTTTITGTAPALSYDANEKIITVKADALTTKNVTVSGNGGYKLAIGSDIANAAVNTTEWVVSGTTANYKNYDKAFYALTNDTTIKYTADTAGITYATVKGLKSGTTIEANAFKKANGTAGNEDGGILTLKAENLGEKTITIASNVAGKNTFSLALASDTDTAAKVSTLSGLPSSVTANNKGTATITGKLSKGFTLEFGGKQLTYNNTDNKAVTVATVTGLKNSATVDVSGSTITLDSTDLANKNVNVTTSWGTTPYTLSYTPTAPGKNVDPNYKGYAGNELDAGTPLNPKGKTPGWTISGTTGTLKGYVTSEGYTMSESGTSLTYTGATQVNTTKNKQGDVTAYTYKDLNTLATIKGLKTTADKTALIDTSGATPTIKLTKANTNGDLTINGGTYAVEVDADYAGKTITGSAGADDLTVQAKGKTITGGKGDDNITFVASNGNTLVYNNGDGNDVVAKFDFTNGKLQVNSGAISVGMVGTDVVVKVGAGSINLGSYSGDTIDIYAKDGKTKTTYAIAGATTGGSNILLEDNNYSMDAASLSDLVQGDSASFTPYDFSSSFSLTKEDKLTPQISYSGSDKK